jgi:hypothetical protein
VTRRLLHALVSLYPPAFRRRYGRELHDLVDELSERETRRLVRSALGLVGGAGREWWQRSRPQAVAALLVPLLALAVGIAIAGRSQPTHVSRATVAERARRELARRTARAVFPTTCFIGDGQCSLMACPELIAPASPLPKARQTPLASTCAVTKGPRMQAHAVFVAAG